MAAHGGTDDGTAAALVDRVFEEVGVALAIAEEEGRLVRVNAAFASFFGVPAAELEGRSLPELAHSDEAAQTAAELAEVMRDGGRGDSAAERRYVAKGGKEVWAHTTLTRLAREPLVVVVLQDIDVRKRAEAGVRTLSGRLLKLQDEERKRIARSLHESAAQTIAALSLNLQRMERMQLPPDAAKALADSLQLVSQSLREVRTLSQLLHPPLLDEAGLASTLRWYVGAFASRSGIDVELHVDETLGRLAPNVETTLFRIVQESLTNIHRHAGSDWASVELSRRGAELVLEVKDRGVGIPAETLERIRVNTPAAVGVGIAGMRERIAQLGGRFEIEATQRGTVVRAVLKDKR